MPYVPHNSITITFRHGTADLADNEWTKNIFCNGTEKTTSITVVQVKDNYYKATFTPTMAAIWDIHLEENSERHHFTFHVEKEETLQLIRTRLAQIEQMLRNRP